MSNLHLVPATSLAKSHHMHARTKEEGSKFYTPAFGRIKDGETHSEVEPVSTIHAGLVSCFSTAIKAHHSTS